MQVASLRKAGCRRIVHETASGALRRPALEQLLDRLKPGDQLLVFKVDRLARTMRSLLEVQDQLRQAGATLRSVTEPIDTGTPIGEAFFQLLGVFAQLERSMIRERCELGRREARERGVRFGRPPLLRESDVRGLVELGLPLVDTAKRCGVSTDALRYHLAKYGLRCAVDGRTLRYSKHA